MSVWAQVRESQGAIAGKEEVERGLEQVCNLVYKMARHYAYGSRCACTLFPCSSRSLARFVS
eukprot:1529237-Rhodomonas_salina.1